MKLVRSLHKQKSSNKSDTIPISVANIGVFAKEVSIIIFGPYSDLEVTKRDQQYY